MKLIILSCIGTILLAIPVIYKLISKWSPKVKWAAKLVNELLDVAHTVLDAVEDRKITKQEMQSIINAIENVKDILE